MFKQFFILLTLFFVVKGLQTPLLVAFDRYGKDSQLMAFDKNNQNQTIYFYERQPSDITTKVRNIYFAFFSPGINETSTTFDVCIFPDFTCASGVQKWGTSFSYRSDLYAQIYVNTSDYVVLQIIAYGSRFENENGVDWTSVILMGLAAFAIIFISLLICYLCCACSINAFFKIKNRSATISL